MEDLKIQRFLSICSVSGDGWGDGCSSAGSGKGTVNGEGWGCGDGVTTTSDWSGYGGGYGDGSGSESGDGDGDGSSWGCGASDYGSGRGSDCGIKSYNGRVVYQIDGIPTLVDAVFGDCAKGAILRRELTLEPCYIAKREGCFAHGETLREAVADATEKAFEMLPEEKRIDAFLEEHVPGVKYPHHDFYDWHHRLTGSCEMGRKEFARAHGLDIDSGEMTVDEFLELTENAFGAETIRKLKKRWQERRMEG